MKRFLIPVLAVLAVLSIALIALEPWKQEPPVPLPEPTPAAAHLPAPEPVPEAPPPEAPSEPIVLPKLAPLVEKNPDVVGWIQMPNTLVDYPVARSNDNDYYLHRDLEGREYYPGTIFMDFRNAGDGNDRHTIIYGHNMKDGSMFGTLKRYKKQDFYDANRFFTYSTLYADTRWEIFAAYVSPATLDLIPTDFKDDAAFMDFVKTRQSKSAYAQDIELKPTDKVLTLITCTYELRDARYVIHARRVE